MVRTITWYELLTDSPGFKPFIGYFHDCRDVGVLRFDLACFSVCLTMKTCICLLFSLVHCVVLVSCDWRLELLWFCITKVEKTYLIYTIEYNVQRTWKHFFFRIVARHLWGVSHLRHKVLSKIGGLFPNCNKMSENLRAHLISWLQGDP